jgi:phosphatidylglycerol:prolipoprotein diacylglycerol transferase
LIPYVEIHPIRIGPVTVHIFGALIAIGVTGGYFWLLARLRATGADTRYFSGAVFWMLAIGFPGSMLVKLIYYPNLLHMLWTAPGELARAARGISSYGGFIFGLLGGWLYLWLARAGGDTIWRYADALGYVFPRSWLFGRMGCALTHDHPGIRTESWLGVRFPEGTRFDLGLLEVLFILAYLAALPAIDRRPRPAGFYMGLFLTVYGIFRLGLDRLHEAPPRYLGWTVDQITSTVAIAAGLLIFAAIRRRTPRAKASAAG